MSTSSGKSPFGDGKRRPRKKSAPPETKNLGEGGVVVSPLAEVPAKGLKTPPPAKSARKSKEPAPSSKFLPSRGLALGGWMAGLALLALGLVSLWWINRELGRDPKILSSASVLFSSISCPTPQAMGRDAFLEEVRYIGHVDQELNLLDPSLPSILAAAFRSHPWVAEVERVEIFPGTTRLGQPKAGKVEVKLRFRQPVLRVPLEGETLPGEPAEREVDPLGTLLPARPAFSGVPTLATRRQGLPPTPGNMWNDTIVQGGAKVAGELAKAGILERVKGLRSVGAGWELETAKGPVFWGRTPGFETAGEPPVAEKCRKLGQWLSAPVDTSPPDLSKAV